jgi:uncharacterized membrane protein
VTTKRGAKLRLRFKLTNGTYGSLVDAKLSPSIPSSLSKTKGTATTVEDIFAGDSRSLTVTLRVGKHARIGKHKVKVSVGIGSNKVTQTVTVVVKKG